MQTHQEKLEYMRAWRAQNLERARGFSRRWREANKEAVSARQKDYRKRNKDKVAAAKKKYYELNKARHKATTARAYFLRVYGITPEQRDEMFVSQGSVCAICKSPSPRGRRGWFTDHCHKTGKVRGVLCNYCNTMLGWAADDPAVLASGAKYLVRV